ncbi:hypothetical protein P788_2834 [Enterococcus faecalis MTUP9]|nr:hypothetical protein P788_2834 [Enterococcus faecalis MTUP9]
MFTLGKKVVILGNGFDLSSGLEPKYSDFFNELMQNCKIS